MDNEEQRKGRDILWFIWASPNSPLFGKDKMTTFERYFIADKATHKEVKGAYYRLLENEEVIDSLLREFGLDPAKGHIINGHVPVHQGEGESPVKCGGKVIVIDGGFCKAYHKVTGIAGYTLVYNSYGLILCAHESFTSAEDAVSKESDIVSNRVAVHYTTKRRLVRYRYRNCSQGKDWRADAASGRIPARNHQREKIRRKTTWVEFLE